MLISKFRQKHNQDAVTIPFSQIVLTEHCHKKAVAKGHKISELDRDPVCIVRRLESLDGEPQYALVSGYRDYITARNLGMPEVKAIIVPDGNRRDFVRRLNKIFEWWETSDVHEPSNWMPPNPSKIANCRKNYENIGTFGKAIVISPKGTILDGYAAVCTARELGIEKILVFVLPTSTWLKLQVQNKKMKIFSKTP